MPVPHHSVFACRMPFLPPNQQRKALSTYVMLMKLVYQAPSTAKLHTKLKLELWICQAKRTMLRSTNNWNVYAYVGLMQSSVISFTSLVLTKCRILPEMLRLDDKKQHTTNSVIVLGFIQAPIQQTRGLQGTFSLWLPHVYFYFLFTVTSPKADRFSNFFHSSTRQ